MTGAPATDPAKYESGHRATLGGRSTSRWAWFGFAVELDESAFKVAHTAPHDLQAGLVTVGEHLVPVFGQENHVCVQNEYAVPTGVYVVIFGHKPSLGCRCAAVVQLPSLSERGSALVALPEGSGGVRPTATSSTPCLAGVTAVRSRLPRFRSRKGNPQAVRFTANSRFRL